MSGINIKIEIPKTETMEKLIQRHKYLTQQLEENLQEITREARTFEFLEKEASEIMASSQSKHTQEWF